MMIIHCPQCQGQVYSGTTQTGMVFENCPGVACPTCAAKDEEIARLTAAVRNQARLDAMHERERLHAKAIRARLRGKSVEEEHETHTTDYLLGINFYVERLITECAEKDTEIARLTEKLPCGHYRHNNDDSYGGCVTCKFHAGEVEADREIDRLTARLASLEAQVAALTAERDALKRHYDAAAPEHNLLALLDLYYDERRQAQAERDEALRDLAAWQAAAGR